MGTSTGILWDQVAGRPWDQTMGRSKYVRRTSVSTVSILACVNFESPLDIFI